MTPPEVDTTTITFDPSTKENGTLYIPKGALALYQAADEWKDFVNIVETDFAD